MILVYNICPPKKNQDDSIQTLKISSPKKICLMSFPKGTMSCTDRLMLCFRTGGRTLPVTQPEASMMSISPVYGHGPPAEFRNPSGTNGCISTTAYSNNLVGGFTIFSSIWIIPPR